MFKTAIAVCKQYLDKLFSWTL